MSFWSLYEHKETEKKKRSKKRDAVEKLRDGMLIVSLQPLVQVQLLVWQQLVQCSWDYVDTLVYNVPLVRLDKRDE